MIFAVFLGLGQAVLNFFIAILPTDTTGLVPLITTAFSYLISTLWAFDFILPVHDILQVLQWSIYFTAAVLVFKFIEWIIRKIPFLGMR